MLNAGFDLPLGTSLSDTIQNWQHNGATGTYRPTRAQYPTPLEVCFNSQPCSLNHPLFSPPAVLLALHSLPACFPHLLFFTSHTCFSLELPHILSFFFFFFHFPLKLPAFLNMAYLGKNTAVSQLIQNHTPNPGTAYSLSFVAAHRADGYSFPSLTAAITTSPNNQVLLLQRVVWFGVCVQSV